MKVEKKSLIRLFITFIFILMIIPCLSAADASNSNSINNVSTSDVSQDSQIDSSADTIDISENTADNSSNILNIASQDSQLREDIQYGFASSMDEGVWNNAASSMDGGVQNIAASSMDGCVWNNAASSRDEGIQTESSSMDEILRSTGASIYVNASGGSDSNAGEDWSNAVQSIGHALSIADENCSIYLADGIYNLASAQTISKNISLIGQSRDGTVLAGSSCQGFIISEGISFKASRLCFENFKGENGGAISCFGTLTLSDALFINNQAAKGGAVYLQNSSASISESKFIANSAQDGGALFAFSNDAPADVIISACTFINNSADNGGAVYLINITDSSSVDNSLFVGNGPLSIVSSADLKIGDNNWFGNNAADAELDSSLFGSEVIMPSKWLVLHVIADDETVFLGDWVTISCLFRDNDGNRIDGSELPRDMKAVFDISGIDSFEKDFQNAMAIHTYQTVVSGDNIISANVCGASSSTIKRVFTTLDCVYVNISGGSNRNSGSDWANALESLDYALSILNDGGTLYLADGIYHISNSAVQVIARNMAFVGESQNGTILDGSYGFGYNISSEVTFSASSLTFRNFHNYDSSIYGAVFEVMGTLNLDKVSFYNNTSPYSNGGAIDLANTGTGNLHITGSYFENNRAIEGGCISSYGFMDVDIINTTFASNYVSWNGGAISIKDGTNYDYVFNISGCSFINNYCTDMDDSYGGAVYIRASVASITDSIFINNSAEWGGAIGSYTSYNLDVQGSLFLNNTNVSRGGAIYLYSFNNPKINYNIFINNVASYDLNADGDDSVIGFGGADSYSIENNWFGHSAGSAGFDNSIISNLDAPSEYLVLNWSCDSNILDVGDLALIRYDLTRTQKGNSIDAGRLPDFKIALNSVNGDISADEAYFANGLAQVTFNASNVGDAAVIMDLYDKSISIPFIVNALSNFTFSIEDMDYGNAGKLAITVPANAAGSMTVSLNGANYTGDIENGMAIISVPELSAGRYSVLVSYSGDGEYAGFIKQANFTVNDVYSLSAGNLNAFYKYGTALVATLYKNGKPFSGAGVSYSFGSSRNSYKTNSLGQAKFIVTNLKPGSYNIKVSYGSLSKTVRVVVKKAAVKYTRISKTVKKGKYFSLKVLSRNNLVVKKRKVSIKIGRRTYNVKTNSKGIAKVKVKLSPKKYKVVVKMVSNPYYTTSKKTVKVRVKK